MRAAEAERRLAAEAERARVEIEALTAKAAEAAERHKKELDAVREEWQGRMQAGIADVTASRSPVIAETDRIRREAEEAAAGVSCARCARSWSRRRRRPRARLREEMDQALTAERERADVDLQGERSRVHALIAERDHAASDLEAERLKTQTLTPGARRSAGGRDARARISARRDGCRPRHGINNREARKTRRRLIEARAAERQAQLAAVERLLGVRARRSAAPGLSATR